MGNMIRSWGKSVFQLFLNVGIAIAKFLMNLVRSNKFIYNTLYDFANLHEFSDLYEHEKMLADSVRVNTYAEAIRRHIKEGDVVVDLGTGSGILSILAARQGAQVYAIDHSDFITIAEQIAKKNGVHTIKFLQTNSKSFNPEEKVDVLLHEQIGDDLFNENMVENLLDMKRRMLKDTGIILPGRFELFMEPVSLKEDFRVPFIWEISIQDVQFDFMQHLPDAQKYKPAKYPRRFVETAGFNFFLSDPQPVLTVDLNQMTDPDTIPMTFKLSRRVVSPGRMDGIYQFFRVVFDDDIHFDTAPTHTKTHWANRLFRLPHKEYAEGDVINYTFTMGNVRQTNTWTVKLNE